ncbi:MAG TPA: OsmC family protein [Ktedonobacteraceae bacterium]|nr:OsmC family protein [Ktedonobacteraceae bacterium]
MAKELDLTAKLMGGMRFHVETKSGHGIDLDMAPGEGGSGAGPQPMEMLLVGLAGCSGMSTLLILRKRKQDVRDYKITIHGERAELHPQVFTEITIEHEITGKALKPEVIERALLMTEQKYCGASIMLEKTAHLKHTYKIVEVI